MVIGTDDNKVLIDVDIDFAGLSAQDKRTIELGLKGLAYLINAVLDNLDQFNPFIEHLLLFSSRQIGERG